MNNLIIGNIFSFFSASCLAISVTRQSKKGVLIWQIYNISFYLIAGVLLQTYAALVTSSVALLRNVLAYKDKLTMRLTLILVIFGAAFSLYVNNLGIIGMMPVVASVEYTTCIYISKNEQHLRYAFVVNALLWALHNYFVHAYPSSLVNVFLVVWTMLQIFINRKKFAKDKK